MTRATLKYVFADLVTSYYSTARARAIISSDDDDGVCYPRQRLSVCLCVCLFFRTISQKPTQLRSPNWAKKCSTMSRGNPFILGSNGRM